MTKTDNPLEQQNLETIVANQPSKKKIVAVDTAGNITYSLLVGIALDSCAGLNCAGIVASRASATVLNAATGGLYGWWREQAYRVTQTTTESGKVRKTLVNLLAFNTFQVPVYAVVVAIGSYFSEGQINWKKVQDGTAFVTGISPLIGPTMGWYMDAFRELCEVNTAIERAYKTEED